MLPLLTMPVYANEADEPVKIGNESFQKAMELFPEIWNAETGRTAPAFTWQGTPTAAVTIVEEVYVEVPVDTDGDGRRDLIRVTIRRPVQSRDRAELKIPAFYEMSPYRDGTHSYPFHQVKYEMSATPDTSHYTYEEYVQSLQPRASEWYWGYDEVFWDPDIREWLPGKPPGYEFGLPNPMINTPPGSYYIPAARTSSNEGNLRTEGNTSVSSAYGAIGGTFAQYMYVRGVANISSNSVGNRYAEGVTSCGDVDETLV